MDFYQTLNYSLGNEDWVVEKQALRVDLNNKILCITASGDRPLHLLMTDCSQVVSFDLNPVQTYLLELKIAACLHLDYEKYIAFLGCQFIEKRNQIYLELRQSLSQNAKKYWDMHPQIIEKGVIFQGKTERLILWAAFFIKLFRNKKVKKLFEFENIATQKDFLEKKWETFSWKTLFKLSLTSKTLRVFLKDPGLTYTEHTRNPGQYLHYKILSYLQNNLAKNSALLQLLFTGELASHHYFPYLTFSGYSQIKSRLSRLTFQTGNIIDYLLMQPSAQFDCYSMSDIASYMSQADFEKLLQGMKQTARPNARFCLREFMSNRYVPQSLTPYFQRDAYLEAKLEREESNCVYRFMVGCIR